ncbi:MAG: FAD-dependent oxidoreductase [Desulfobacteraceae bacterium]|nr:FAD-dependent oxidoreductase [Desulfobacteraceae bacterium]
MYDNLFSPIALGNLTLPNRICFLAHRTNFARRGRIDDRHVAYYRRRAKGGCGLIIVGELSIHPNDRPWEAMIKGYGERVILDYRKLTEAVHEFEIPIFAQLCHHGFQSSGAISRRGVWGPSAIADIAFGETAKTMEPEDIKTVVEAYARAAELAREGGFDGLEIDMGSESLLRQFLSPISNHRDDQYGGSPENRLRLSLEVIHKVRQAVGADFTVGARLCLDEQFWGGITIDDSVNFAESLEKTGKADFLNATLGTYYNLHLNMASMHTAEGFALDLADQVKRAVSIPVIAAHQISTPQMAEEILANGQADIIGLMRPLICDPDFPAKAREGRVDEIRLCVRDNQGCIGRINRSRTLGCIQNPDVGFEDCRLRIADCGMKNTDQSLITNPMSKVQGPRSDVQGPKSEVRSPKSEDNHQSAIGNRQSAIKKRVIVVGGGPGGLEAARVAREKGHEVTLYEMEDRVGGQINLAKKGVGREGMAEIIRHLTRMLEALEVEIITGKEVTSDFVLEKRSDAVIVATGSRPKKRPVPGEYGPPFVLNVEEVLEGRFPVGEKVIFVDENGGHHATATVELLADQGKQVDMVTSELFIGMDLAPINDLYLTRQRLLQKGVTFRTDLVVDAIDGAGVAAHDIFTNEPVILEGYDTIVLDMGNESIDRLYRELKGRVNGLYRVGDCVAPRGIGMAILEGNRVGGRL